MPPTPGTVLFRRAGTSLLLAGGGAEPFGIVHWGSDLGDLDRADQEAAVAVTVPPVPHSALDRPARSGLLPEAARGWTGRPGLSGHRLGVGSDRPPPVDPLLATVAVDVDQASATSTCTVRAEDARLGLQVTSTVELTFEGVLRVRHVLANVGEQPYALAGLLASLPLAAPATELLDLTGRWCRERHPQRRALQQGAWVRDGRHGRTGHDASLLLVAGTPGFGFGHGQVWGVHVAWSGDHRTWAERLPTGEGVLGGGELLGPGEVVLDPGEQYASPWLVAAWSDRGLDGLTDRLHRYVRARPRHPTRSRPVVLNTWEAVYFDHDVERLRELAGTAARLGVERFVLDDGWFSGRRNDRAGLGDWTVDATVWPDGLHPLVDHVRDLGMEFGLWVEPEMVNPDSDLARAHPDWLLRGRDQDPPSWRNQQLLDLRHPAAYEHVVQALLALLDEYEIGFLKWDMNRDLVDTAGAVHEQTLAVYRMLDELREAQPGLEIESCASGGARVDLAVLERTDRVWASDCNDPLERQHIQRWTGLLLPPELVGAHVGASPAPTTGRAQRLSFRAATALFGHFGIECDVRQLSPAQAEELAGWVRLYQAERGLLHSGRTVRADSSDPAQWVHGVVSPTRDRGLFAVVGLASSAQAVPAPVRLPGLDPDRRYDVQVVGPPPADSPPRSALSASWTEHGPVRLAGSVLTDLGVTLPPLLPESATVLRVTAAGSVRA